VYTKPNIVKVEADCPSPRHVFDQPQSTEMNFEKDYYGFMGLSQSVDVNIINAVFRILAKKYHPDTHGGPKNEAERLFRELKEAHESNFSLL